MLEGVLLDIGFIADADLLAVTVRIKDVVGNMTRVKDKYI